MGSRFEDSFWETDFNGTLGFDLLCKRIREGQKVCRDIEEFFKKKAKAEMQFSKALRALARSADGKEELGGLGLSWQEMKQQTEKTANYHETSANELNKLADDLSQFTDVIKLASKQIEDKVKERQKVKRTAHSKMHELQRSYNDKCRDTIANEHQLDAAKQSVTITTKETEKLKSKAEKSREAMEKADILYKQSVEVLEECRIAWEADMEEACKAFQKQEEDRIYILRDMLWKCTNIDSQLCVDWDTSSEHVRTCLEKCDVSEDNWEFIKTNMTGSSRPQQIEYESYFDDRSKTTKVPQNRLPRPPPSLPRSPSNGANQPYDFSKVYSYATN